MHHPLGINLQLDWHFWGDDFQILKLLFVANDTDEVSVPEMRIWSILLIKSH